MYLSLQNSESEDKWRTSQKVLNCELKIISIINFLSVGMFTMYWVITTFHTHFVITYNFVENISFTRCYKLFFLCKSHITSSIVALGFKIQSDLRRWNQGKWSPRKPLALIDPLYQFLGIWVPQSHHPRSPQIQTSKATVLPVDLVSINYRISFSKMCIKCVYHLDEHSEVLLTGLIMPQSQWQRYKKTLEVCTVQLIFTQPCGNSLQ